MSNPAEAGFTLNNAVVDTPPRPSSTVLLLRDGHDGKSGLEVLMQRRHERNDVLANAYVFPGGKVDKADSEIEMMSRLDLPAASIHARMADSDLDERGAAVYFAAACREIFEEAGLLLAVRGDGAPVTAEDAEQAMQWLRQGLGFVEVLERFNLTMRASALVPWTRWITPRMPTVMNKRFDVRFFLARTPEGQTAIHDNHEAVESVWLAPRDALARYQAREMMLAAPQLMSLVELARYPSVDAAMHVDAVNWPRLIEPHPFDHEGNRAVAYPGDPLHSNPQRAMPGPTRLVFREGRFEPFGHYDELLA